MFIVFEGIDGAGKTTQIKKLKKFLSKTKKVSSFKYPSKNFIGKFIKNSVVYSKNIPEVDSLMFLSDMLSNQEVIKKDLDNEKIVLCDRYYYSLLAYQGIGEFDPFILKPFFDKLIKPDLVFVFLCNASVGLRRIEKEEKNKYESLKVLQQVEKKYEFMHKSVSEKIINIDSSLKPNEIHEIIVKEVLSRL